MKLVRIFSIALIAMSITLVSCSGEDGEQGPPGKNGNDGAPGLNGDNGAPGQDGADGLGFDELTQYGSISLNLEGVRSDGVAFTDASSFKFNPAQFGDLQTNEVSITEPVLDQTLHDFDILRFLSAPDNSYQDTYIYMDPSIINIGQDTETINDFNFLLTSYPVIGEDNKYFVLTLFYPALQNLELTDLAFDEADNHLTYSFAFDVAAIDNATGNTLSVSGSVDVYVLEKIQ
ncbi:collagen-like protein [Allomuricauda sp. NBRC 101325]|uniref:collagen-like triple helix repeat-containing protein n=1 Tax=Allomuricauda sp. NBRC 101325 TaxID=1113758 RepID=UPI0024A2F0DC|nr:collagen-like protein [Muricauda sp. NBRC 101325]GLU42656.1 hypothetical protein Musp01_02800 [Muricauda sp. NBRC 101325]